MSGGCVTVHVQSQPPLGDLLDRLARELLAQPTAQEVLDRVVALAQLGIPGAASVGISMVDKGPRVSTVAASDDLARQGDSLQYEFGEGPCLDAVWAEEEVHAADL